MLTLTSLPSACKADTTNDLHSLNFSTILTGCSEQMLLGFDHRRAILTVDGNSFQRNHVLLRHVYISNKNVFPDAQNRAGIIT